MKALWLVLLMLAGVPAAHADRGIVYAARYYTPPGSHRTSHFHLYRINPDGTGKTQLTFGTSDEENPTWTVDGRHIIFVQYYRYFDADQSPPMLCEVDENGKKRHVLKVLTEAAAFPNPPAVFGYRLDNDETDNDRAATRHILINLKTNARQTLKVPVDGDGSDVLLPMPGTDLVYAVNNHNSTVGTDYLFYRLNTHMGSMRYLTEGQFLAWSPNGLQFCVAPGRDTTPYKKRSEPFPIRHGASAEERAEDEYRTVWFAPLYVRAAAGGPMKQITPRLSYVTGADWRKEK